MRKIKKRPVRRKIGQLFEHRGSLFVVDNTGRLWQLVFTPKGHWHWVDFPDLPDLQT